MRHVDKTSEQTQDRGPEPRTANTPLPKRSESTEIAVPPKVLKAIEKHQGDLAELMKRYAYQWAAYRGDERLEIGRSKRRLYHKYLDRGLSLDELVVLGIGPQIPDEIDGDEWSDA